VLPDLLANQAKAPLPVSVTTRTDGEELAQGSLVFIDSQVDPTTGQIKLKAAFANTDRKLWPGELVTARVLVQTARQRIAVPSRAIVNTQAGTQVFAIAPDGKVQMKAVQTGVSVDGMTEIKSGIQAGDLIVFDGQSRLNPGVLVAAKIVNASAEAAAAPATTANMDSP
jgi:membrane fusion protein, multidrug efflux system